MNNKPLLLGGALLVLVVAGVGGFWFTSSGASGPGTAAAAPGQSGFFSGGGAPADLAQEPIPVDRAEAVQMTVYSSPTCGCCTEWMAHAEEHGFEIDVQHRMDMAPVKREFGVGPDLYSCHTAIVNGYVIEGHVPGDVIRQFLAEAPAVRGLAVPGMPIGSPGMEMDGIVERYDVLTFTSDGRTEVYSEQGR